MYEIVGQVQTSSSVGSDRTEGAGRVDINTACNSTVLLPMQIAKVNLPAPYLKS